MAGKHSHDVYFPKRIILNSPLPPRSGCKKLFHGVKGFNILLLRLRPSSLYLSTATQSALHPGQVQLQPVAPSRTLLWGFLRFREGRFPRRRAALHPSRYRCGCCWLDCSLGCCDSEERRMVWVYIRGYGVCAQGNGFLRARRRCVFYFSSVGSYWKLCDWMNFLFLLCDLNKLDWK